MATTFPGTTIEVSKLTRSSSRILFDSIFCAGGVTLSQVSLMTGIEPYAIQNWVKRGFVGSPQHRLYSKNQFARIVIINMLRESLQIEKICELIRGISGVLADESDDLISAYELYHMYVDLISTCEFNIHDKDSVQNVASAAADTVDSDAHTRAQISRILQIMIYARAAVVLRQKAEILFASLDQ